ncbi:accessory gene regulator B family protein [Enterococcus sp. BWB1-3]|nr:accessory gene regulator B family protein [Enterococcus sp. BWB1-3]
MKKTALILNVGFETLILHLSFLTVRVFAYGEHAGSSFGCIKLVVFYCLSVLPAC